METYLVYFDETGDDGNNTKSSDSFILTSIHMNSNVWKSNFQKMKELRKYLKETYGFLQSDEMHTKYFITDKDPYRKYKFDIDTRRAILISFIKTISELDIKITNVLIDKTKIQKESYDVLDSALRYSIQRIENTSHGNWNYVIITDKGRLAPMRKTARAMCVYNPIPDRFGTYVFNVPVKNMIEDILEKDSKDSTFIQICDFVSYFFHMYHKKIIKKESLPKRVEQVIDREFLMRTMKTFEVGNVLNTPASKDNHLGLVIYPKP